MSKRNIAILSEDTPYIQAFTTYLVFSKKNNFQIFNFHHIQEVKEAYRLQPLDLLLLAEEYLELELDFDPALPVVVMTEALSKVPEERYKRMMRYQRMDAMEEAIGRLAASQGNRVPVPAFNRFERIIGIYSPMGGGGKTTVGVGLSLALAEIAAKVLYMPLEGLYTFRDIGNLPCSNGNLSEMIYHFHKIRKIPSVQWTLPVEKGAEGYLHYFRPVDASGDLDHLDGKLLQSAIRHLMDHTGYQFVVLDLGNAMTPFQRDAMEGCDEIWCIVAGGIRGHQKQEAWKRDLAAQQLDHWLEKTVPVVNQVNPGMEEMEMQGEGRHGIPWVPEASKVQNGVLGIEMGGQFGEAVRRIAQERMDAWKG
ncbi:hypothetical protein [Anaerotalea alkaliphila]|uniref:ParA family protein n=1 Tax=Anaerotalea alkaliphila TaxID=2662126 RepID=A0A7X5KLC6_9FIRM|nr:hypothetical protein [Anaerotalea alkaliphila]NDL66691.1 hypothetical protein [Anaerotalea alkaliphila]